MVLENRMKANRKIRMSGWKLKVTTWFLPHLHNAVGTGFEKTLPFSWKSPPKHTKQRRFISSSFHRIGAG